MKRITLTIPHSAAKDVHEALQDSYERLAAKALDRKDNKKGTEAVALMRRALALDLIRHNLHEQARLEVFGW